MPHHPAMVVCGKRFAIGRHICANLNKSVKKYIRQEMCFMCTKRRTKEIATKRLGWTGAVLCFAVLSGGILSVWFHVTWHGRFESRGQYMTQDQHLFRLALSDGRFSVLAWIDKGGMSGLPSPRSLWTWGRSPDSPRWRLWFARQEFLPGSSFSGWSLFVPFWVPLIACGLPTFVFWTRHRLRPGCCSCGYSRAGLSKEMPCPECGEAARHSTLNVRPPIRSGIDAR